MGLRLGLTGKSISAKLAEAVWETGGVLDPRCSDEQVQKARQLLEYLQLMEAGLDSFLESFRKQ